MNVVIDDEQDDGDIMVDDIDGDSFNSKAKNKVKEKNKKLLTDLNDEEDEEETQSPSELSKKAALFFDQPLFKKVMEKYDENKEYDQNSKTKNIKSDANNDPKPAPEKNKLVENEPEKDEEENIKISQVNEKKSLKRKAEAVRKNKYTYIYF